MNAAPIELSANVFPRFYRGGAQIAQFRGLRPEAGTGPEDWIGSAVTVLGEQHLGVTVLPDGTRLDRAIQENPVHWLGRARVERFGADPGLLVKLLDAGERLPIHAHPDRAFAGRHLGLTHGKTEAWIALEPAQVHLGFRRAIDHRELVEWVSAQASEAMLAEMHTLEVEPGDAVLVPAGLPHAIGAGAFVVELQEPTDLSILMEWRGFDIDGPRDGHLGLGHATALEAVDTRAWPVEDLRRLIQARRGTEGELLPGAAEHFSAQRWTGSGTWEPDLTIVVVISGAGVLRTERGARAQLRAGTTWLLPHATGRVELVAGEGLELIRCRAAAVETGQPQT